MKSITEEQYSAFLDDLLSGRRAGCTQFVQGLLDDGVDLRTLYFDLFQRALYEVGHLWEVNRISVAVEHLATATVESLFSLVYPILFSRERVGRSAIIACVANEYHQVGAKMIADVLELNGWDGAFLGANTPIGDLLHLIDDSGPRFVGLSLAIFFNLRELLEAIERIRGRFDDLPILVGGQVFRWGGKEAVEAFPSVHLVGDLWLFEESLAGLE